MLQDMNNMEASCGFYVKVGRFDQDEQHKICILTVTSFGIVRFSQSSCIDGYRVIHV